MPYENCVTILKGRGVFGRNDILRALEQQHSGMSQATYKSKMQKLLDSGKIARIGRNVYCVPDDSMRMYEYEYSELAIHVQKLVQENHPFIEYRIFELVQLNEFLNHQIAQNAIFVSVESDLGSFVFETLKERFPGKVLLNPSPKEYHLYCLDDLIVVVKLPTEAPKGRKENWHTCIEKMLVDIFADKIIKTTFSEAEYPIILEEAFQQYIIDESKMFRYAKRRRADIKIMDTIKNKTNIKLRME